MNKHSILSKIKESMEARYEVLRQAANIAKDEATHQETKQEGKYDTRAIEAAYLAGAQAERLSTLGDEISVISNLLGNTPGPTSSVEICSLVKLEGEDGEVKLVIILPVGAGSKAESDGLPITVLSPQSPLGRALLHKHEHDEVEVEKPQGKEYWTVMEIY